MITRFKLFELVDDMHDFNQIDTKKVEGINVGDYVILKGNSKKYIDQFNNFMTTSIAKVKEINSKSLVVKFLNYVPFKYPSYYRTHFVPMDNVEYSTPSLDAAKNYLLNKTGKHFESIEFSNKEKIDGKSGFFMFLNLIDVLKMNFIKTSNYLNVDDYQYFFTTEHIKNKTKFLEIFDRLLSLKTTCDVAKQNQDARLSFYIGVKNNKLEYGFQNDRDYSILKTGEFDVDYRFIRGLKSFKCLSLIQGILEKSRLFNLNILQNVKEDLKYWYEGVGDILILNEDIVTKTIDKNDIKQDALDTNKLLYKYEKWCDGYRWFNKVYFYIDAEDENKITFYIKIKNKKKGSDDKEI